jgi:hypothetical protein
MTDFNYPNGLEFKTPQGKRAGVLTRNGIFFTTRKNIHWFRKFNGLGISVYILKRLSQRVCWKIKIYYERLDGEYDVYEATVKTFMDKGKVYFDDRDAQRILSKQDFDKIIPYTKPKPQKQLGDEQQ